MAEQTSASAADAPLSKLRSPPGSPGGEAPSKKQRTSVDGEEASSTTALTVPATETSPTPVEQPLEEDTSPTSLEQPLEEDTSVHDQTNDTIVVDDGSDSAYGGSVDSGATSVASDIYQGIVRNGRRYQSLKEGDYYGPADEKQFESMNIGHFVYTVLESAIGHGENPYFRSPLTTNAQRVLDIGCGEGTWAIEVADRFPNLTVYGVDLYPPPATWVAPNCIFEVDDLTKPWTWGHKFDFVHLRWMVGTFTDDEWDTVYRQAYDNLAPGGWIEHLETSIAPECDDDTMPPDHFLRKWGPMFLEITARAGRKMDTVDTMRARIEKAGFTNIQEKLYKVPCGTWPKHPVLKEVGRLRRDEMVSGMEGYCMFLLTNYGLPEPWSPEQVQVFLAEARQHFSNPAIHNYARSRRVWAQKPFTQDEA